MQNPKGRLFKILKGLVASQDLATGSKLCWEFNSCKSKTEGDKA